jgi:hypothetical protein
MGKTIVLVDGENLVFRYQAMLDEGYLPYNETIYTPNIFVWHPEVAEYFLKEVIRVWFYTSVTGDTPAIQEIKDTIARINFRYGGGEYTGDGNLVPRVFKKAKQSHRSRLVDIHIVIDAMRFSFSKGVDQVLFLTGDGDFVSLFEEIMSRGKTVHVGAFSSGLDPRIPSLVDRFINLDQIFFNPQKKIGSK